MERGVPATLEVSTTNVSARMRAMPVVYAVPVASVVAGMVPRLMRTAVVGPGLVGESMLDFIEQCFVV